MEFDKQLKLGHLLLVDRKCRTCGEMKNLVDGLDEEGEVDGDGDRWFKADEYGDMQHMWEYLS